MPSRWNHTVANNRMSLFPYGWVIFHNYIYIYIWSFYPMTVCFISWLLQIMIEYTWESSYLFKILFSLLVDIYPEVELLDHTDIMLSEISQTVSNKYRSLNCKEFWRRKLQVQDGKTEGSWMQLLPRTCHVCNYTWGDSTNSEGILQSQRRKSWASKKISTLKKFWHMMNYWKPLRAKKTAWIITKF